MPYSIHKSDGTVIPIADNTIDSSFYNPSGGSSGGTSPGLGQGIQLIGRNAIDYGAAVAQSFLQMTENFSSATDTQPKGDTALQGQLWFNKTLETLYVRVTPAPSSVLAGSADLAANWRKVMVLNPVTAGDGDIRMSGTGPTFKIEMYGNGGWNQVFPAIYS